MHQDFVARACTASVCASQQVCVQVQAQHGIASSFLSSYQEKVCGIYVMPHTEHKVCACAIAYPTNFH